MNDFYGDYVDEESSEYLLHKEMAALKADYEKTKKERNELATFLANANEQISALIKMLEYHVYLDECSFCAANDDVSSKPVWNAGNFTCPICGNNAVVVNEEQDEFPY